MGFISFMRDERVALLGIGLAAGALISGMLAIVSVVIEDNKIEHPAPKTQYITQETEDSLQLDTLDKLINHPSYSIREVAIKILCDRAVNDPDALHMLLYGITREDYDYRLQCLKALALLVFQTNDASTKLHETKTYVAMVRSLEIGLEDNESPKLDDPFWDEYYLRDMTERTNLLLIYQLIQKNGAEMLVKARFVERWLVRQNWGDSEHEIQKNFNAYKNNRRRNPIRDIIDCIGSADGGAAALRRAGLMPTEETPPYRGEVWGITFSSTVPRGDGDEGPRDSELSAEELRRLRREAFVFNDGTRPVSGSDIVQRMPDDSEE